MGPALPVVLSLVLGLVLVSCSGATQPVRAPNYAKVLQARPTQGAPSSKLLPPVGACRKQVLQHLADESDLLTTPLPPAVRTSVQRLLWGLHPAAQRVLARIDGVWLAENIDGAAALFVPCNLDRQTTTGGFVLLDVGEFPLDSPLRDADVPSLYWHSLAARTQMNEARYSVASLPPESQTPADHASRYLLLHELGHALSILAGEFDVDAHGTTRVTRLQGLAQYSWRYMLTESRYLPLASSEGTVRAVVPRLALGTFEWGSLLGAMDPEAALLAPGYALYKPASSKVLAQYVCANVDKIPQAGFVTPVAARYPTEDFAELFAHAILADEGKLHPNDRVRVDLPFCGVREIASPYFSPWLDAKRAYMRGIVELAR